MQRTVLRMVLPVDITRRRLARHAQHRVPHLRRKSKLQIEQASLTNVLRRRTDLTDLRLLVSHALSGKPFEDLHGEERKKGERRFEKRGEKNETNGERAGADLAFGAERLLGHADVGIGTKAGVAKGGEVRLFVAGLVEVCGSKEVSGRVWESKGEVGLTRFSTVSHLSESCGLKRMS